MANHVWTHSGLNSILVLFRRPKDRKDKAVQQRQTNRQLCRVSARPELSASQPARKVFLGIYSCFIDQAINDIVQPCTQRRLIYLRETMIKRFVSIVTLTHHFNKNYNKNITTFIQYTYRTHL